MQKTRSFRAFALAVCVALLGHLNAQVSQLGTNPTFGSFVGHDIGNSDPVLIKHEANFPITWWTDNIQRMMLNPTLNTNTIMGYPVDQTGYLGLSARPNFFDPLINPGPFSRLHLVDDAGPNTPITYAQQFGFRPWQRNGITFTGNLDQCYVGAKYNGLDTSDVVIQWSDNHLQSFSAADRLRFLFTRNPDAGALTGARSPDGLESFRVTVQNDHQAFVGIGDWYRAGVLAGQFVDPDERLDILDRTIRIRDFADPNLTYQRDGLERILVADPLDGRVYWREASTLGESICEWTMAAAPGPNHLSTGFGPVVPDCPDSQDAVGIGMDLTGATPLSKLNLYTRDFPRGVDVWAEMPTTSCTGVKVYATNGTYENRGVDVDAVNSSGTSITDNFGCNIKVAGPSLYSRGVYAHTLGATTDSRGGEFHSWDNAGTTHGVFGQVGGGINRGFGVRGESHSRAISNHGVAGYAIRNSEQGNEFFGVRGEVNLVGPQQFGYGVFGKAPQVGGEALAYSWAGFFDGDLHITGNGWTNGNQFIASDVQLKTNIEELTGATEILSNLHPRTYDFIAQDHPHLSMLPQGPQMGLLAQEVQNVLPTLVGSTVAPAVFDTLGNEIAGRQDYLGVNYVGLIPVLIAAHNEQQADIAALAEQAAATANVADEMQELRDRLDQLEQLLALCCQNLTLPDTDERNLLDEGNNFNSPADERNLRIQPNPFNEQTTIYYNLERGGRMQLMVNSSDGKQLRVLEDAQMPAGEYQYAWYTADMSAGLYYVTLLLDGEPVVKKAVKVN